MVVLLQFVRIPCEEKELGKGSDVGRILFSEFHVLIVEGRLHFNGEAPHDVLDEGLSKGDAVEVIYIMELLDNF